MIKTRTQEEIRELAKQDPFWVFRKVCPTMTDSELFDLYSVIGWKNEWEKQNAIDYMIEKELFDL